MSVLETIVTGWKEAVDEGLSPDDLTRMAWESGARFVIAAVTDALANPLGQTQNGVLQDVTNTMLQMNQGLGKLARALRETGQ